MTVHSTAEARLRARIAAHARALRIDHAQVCRVLTGERTPGLLFLTAMQRLGADLNVVLAKDPPQKWFKPLRPAFDMSKLELVNPPPHPGALT